MMMVGQHQPVAAAASVTFLVQHPEKSGISNVVVQQPAKVVMQWQ